MAEPDGPDDPRIRKGLVTTSALYEAFDEARAQSRSGEVFVEVELRAHLNPTRMEMIRKATADLIARVKSPCPRCGSPGFGMVERLRGLPCRDCDSPTDEARAERWRCVTGDHEEIREVASGRYGDPYRCGTCNP